MNYFYVKESPYQVGKYVIAHNHESLCLTSTIGSFNIIGARLFNLGFADYLRMCRDIYGAMLVGKNHKYPVAYFSSKEEAERLVKELNERAALVFKNV